MTARTVIGWPESIAEQWHTGLPDRKLILARSRVKISTLRKNLICANAHERLSLMVCPAEHPS